MAQYTVTEQEVFLSTGLKLSEVLPKENNSTYVGRFITRACNDVERFIKKRNVSFYNSYNLALHTDYQKEIIKDGCIEHIFQLYNTGGYVFDERGISKKMPISEDVEDILRPVLDRGV